MAKILIIDDEEMIRSLAERILQRDSHSILMAETGTEAIAIFSEHYESIDIVIIDMLLDDMKGFEILKEFRKLSPEIPGLISSGNYYEEANIPESIKENVYFLQKPYKASDLTNIVNSILSPFNFSLPH